ncbi:MAG: DNA polymerase [Acidimicrobiales bacterium]|nr:DNA polymerase [Acidimicrobiales bacterium]MDG1876192.1 DNA polymerase [Acidimicrobiales bacterium]
MTLPVFSRDDTVAVALAPGVGLGLATTDEHWAIPAADPATILRELHGDVGPRWVWWGRGSAADPIAMAGVPIDRCWDVTVVHRLLNGTWRAPLGVVWASLQKLDLDTLPKMGQLGLLDAPAVEGDRGQPIRPDGHLRPEWIDGGFGETPDRLATWAALALDAMHAQEHLLAGRVDPDRAASTARSESAAELLCAELTTNGLPIDEVEARRLITKATGARPRTMAEEDERRAERDERVFQQLEPRWEINLRNPAEVKAMLRRQGIDLPDTRAWRMEALREDEPVIDALLAWRKAERIATTYGWQWLDEHVRGGRLRGDWSGSDGAAGRMTASAGMHNLPAAMRPLVAAAPGYKLVRADLGQIEPRVLAAVSGDAGFIGATQQDDLYAPVARTLGVERDIAKVAILGAMYGATTGESAGALAGLTKNYPAAMGLLERAAESGKRSEDIFTVGGRRVRMGTTADTEGDIDQAVSAAAARGRYARNALIQGAAAEYFKIWAITVRRRGRALGAEVVLCLHDELLVHTPAEHAAAVAVMVEAAVHEAAHYWSPRREVRFVADVCVIDRWSEVK